VLLRYFKVVPDDVKHDRQFVFSLTGHVLHGNVHANDGIIPYDA
jgi:hypothetical protein